MRLCSPFVFSLSFLLACGPKNIGAPKVEIQSAGEANAIGPSPQTQLSESDDEAPSIEVMEEDINGDGQADLFHVSERGETGAILVRREVDLNWDGRVDVRTWLDPSGQLTHEEMDGDFDGWVDWVDHYSGGVRIRSEVDTDFDHSLDLILYFENGDQVVRRHRDVDGDRQIDRIETEGCIEIDEDRDGVYEVKQGSGCPEEPTG